jgi:hypothetical protein
MLGPAAQAALTVARTDCGTPAVPGAVTTGSKTVTYAPVASWRPGPGPGPGPAPCALTRVWPPARAGAAPPGPGPDRDTGTGPLP